MQEFVSNIQAPHKEKFELAEAEITEITPQRDINTGKTDRSSITYEETTSQGLCTSTQYYKIYDPLIIDNFHKYLEEQQPEHKTSHQEQASRKQDEYTTNQGEKKDVPKRTNKDQKQQDNTQE